MTKLRQKVLQSQNFSYKSFNKIDGTHPFQEAAPGSYVLYQVRKRHGGRVAFFNFNLAKEMGLIDQNHPEELNDDLEAHIIDTFSIQIVNEYDLINNVIVPKKELKPNLYMATRYLQLQHPNKMGKTSGDGRSVWNGNTRHKGVTWDVSSCGTGATCLSPATHLNKKFYQTGDPKISYGCGFSEIDEGISTLFFSEVFNHNNIGTERVLAIIEYQKGLAINVRAHKNLMRPSHFFAPLKQSDQTKLKQVLDYYIDRQVINGVWPAFNGTSLKDIKKRYNFFLDKMTEVFAGISALFEDEYIFCWLDWDGDNILMDGGIIDYGSVRQFGLFHHEYRYDDVQRFSTNILEQKNKAKYILTAFIQAVDFALTGRKKSLEHFKNHPQLQKFEEHFRLCKDYNLVKKIGFNKTNQDYLVKEKRHLIHQFRQDFVYFERAKSKKGLHNVPDGINWSAIYCMRDILRELPQYLLVGKLELSVDDFIDNIKSSYATKKDLMSSPYRDKKVQSFQKNYWQLVKAVADKTNQPLKKILLEITMRSSVINKYDRVTGNSIIHIAQKVMKAKPKLSPLEVFSLVQSFVDRQNLDPEKKSKNNSRQFVRKFLMGGIFKLVREMREGL